MQSRKVLELVLAAALTIVTACGRLESSGSASRQLSVAGHSVPVPTYVPAAQTCAAMPGGTQAAPSPIASASSRVSGYRVCGRFSANAGSSSFTCTLPRDATGPYRLLVYNGAPDGTARASSALILVNGVEVLGPHIFGFGSLTGGTPGPVRAEAEGIALGGYDSHGGWYVGDIGAIGAEVGGAQNYIGGFLGTETTSLCPSPTKIKLSEVSLGAEVPLLGGIGVGGGRYSTDDDRGTFFFVSGGILGKHASVGVGFSTQGWWETMKQWFE